MSDERPQTVSPLKQRTKDYALSVIRLFGQLPHTSEAQILGRQWMRSATSVGAHWREGHRSRSSAEFISKMEGALQELEESAYWLELLTDSGIVSPDLARPLLNEANELTAMLVSSVKTVKARGL